MPYVFAFGIARSGTTLLGRLLATTSTPARFVSELCPGIADRIPNPVFMVEPGDSETVARVRESIVELSEGRSPFGAADAYRLERDDPDAEVLIVKDVHSLLAYPEILAGLDAWRAVVITRDVRRSLDSYFHGHRPEQRRYLMQEHAYLAGHIGAAPADSLIGTAATRVHPRVVRYLKRPRLLTSELLRQAAVSELVIQFLRRWAERDERVMHVRFEDLCRDPLREATRLLDFAGLKSDDRTLAEIRRTTTGGSTGYYDTDKDSQRILDQPYRYLGARALRRLDRFLGTGQPC